MKRIVALFLAFALLPSVARAISNDPATVTQAAYDTARSYFGDSHGPLQFLKFYLTPDLYAALQKKASQPVPQGGTPNFEGNPLFEYKDLPEGFSVARRGLVEGTMAHVPVSLSWGNERGHYIVLLVQINGAWKIADIDYGKDGKLTDLLK